MTKITIQNIWVYPDIPRYPSRIWVPTQVTPIQMGTHPTPPLRYVSGYPMPNTVLGGYRRKLLSNEIYGTVPSFTQLVNMSF
jgi:hypothetical protein